MSDKSLCLCLCLSHSFLLLFFHFLFSSPFGVSFNLFCFACSIVPFFCLFYVFALQERLLIICPSKYLVCCCLYLLLWAQRKALVMDITSSSKLAVCSASVQLVPCLSSSASVSRLQLFLGLLLILCQRLVCDAGAAFFRYLFQPHSLLRICLVTTSCLAQFRSSLFPVWANVQCQFKAQDGSIVLEVHMRTTPPLRSIPTAALKTGLMVWPTVACNSSPSSSYAEWRCLPPARKQLASLALPGCRRACPSVVSALATCHASEHQVAGELQQVLRIRGVCLAWAGCLQCSPYLPLNCRLPLVASLSFSKFPLVSVDGRYFFLSLVDLRSVVYRVDNKISVSKSAVRHGLESNHKPSTLKSGAWFLDQ